MSDDRQHGGAIDKFASMFPNAPLPWIDLSTGINPWPYPVNHRTLASIEKLPSTTDYNRCRDAMATALNASKENLALGPGSELIISLLPTLITPKNIAVLSPTYGDHAQRWAAAGAEIIRSEAPLEMAGSVDAIVVCNPNNPDGRTFSVEELETAREKLAANNGFLIVDEAFADLCPEKSMASRGGAPGLIILRSFGKFYGLPGLRLGAVIAPADVCSGLSKQLGAWPVSSIALEIGARAYKDGDWQKRTLEKLATASNHLDEILKEAGLAVTGGTSLYRFVEIPDATQNWNKLANAGICVRRFSWSNKFLRFGLPSNADEEKRLAAALAL